ncbi:MAG TPA: hypothetical protein DEF07_10115 [Nitrosomonas sp.]|nr:hypothetical protein [Nitrosomonas sp.]
MDKSRIYNWLIKHSTVIVTLGAIAAMASLIWPSTNYEEKSATSITQNNNSAQNTPSLVAKDNAKIEAGHIGDAHHHYGLGVDDAMKLAEKLAAEKGEEDARIIQSLQETIQALTRQNASQYDIQQALDMLAQGNTEKAEEIFEGAAAEAKRMGKEANVKEAEALRHLGSLAFLHDTQKAFNAYQRSTELDPDSQEGWNQLGHLYRRIGELENAENAYMTLLKLARTDQVGQAVAYGNLGLVYYTRGDLDQAVGYWEKSLALFTEIGAKPQMAQVQSLLDNAQSEHSE